MGKTEQLERSLDVERLELGRNLRELESKARALKDWRTYYRHRPWAVVGAAFGGALIFGLLSGKRSPIPTTFSGELQADGGKQDAGFRGSPQVAASMDRVKRHAGDTWDHIADALMGVAAAKAIHFVSQRVPGFGEEYSKRNAETAARTSSGY